jgi:hypothetical protein
LYNKNITGTKEDKITKYKAFCGKKNENEDCAASFNNALSILIA